MSTEILRSQGVEPLRTKPAKIIDYELTICPRVNVEAKRGSVVYGGLSWVTHTDIDRLYGHLEQEYGLIYRPWPAVAWAGQETIVSALCFIAEHMDEGEADPLYIDALAASARELEAPESYIDHIYLFLS